MGIEAIATGLFSLASAGVAAHSAKSVSAANAAAQANLNEKTMKFNREEAAKARNWSSAESAVEREFNAEQADIGRMFSKEQTLAARAYEERMSNTAHQREILDLQKAGLNPILSASGGQGAAVPVSPIIGSANASQGSIGSAASASVSGLQAPRKTDYLGTFVNTAMEGLRLDNDIKRAKADEVRAEAEKSQAETASKRQVADERHIDQQIKTLQADERWKDFAAKSEEEKIKLVKEQIISEKLRQGNEKRLTDARVAEAGAIAYQAVKNADTEAQYKATLGKMAEAHNENEKQRLGYEAQELKYKYETGQKALERDWIEKHPYWSHTLMTVDKVISACSPIKLGRLKD